MRRTGDRRVVAAVLVLLACAVWGFHEVGAVHAVASERSWLRSDGTRVTGSVSELGTARPDQSPESVWIALPGSAQTCFVTTGADVGVLREGSAVSAVVDERNPSETCTGVSTDLLSRSFAQGYGAAVAGPAGTAVVLLGLVALVPVPRRRSAGAGTAPPHVHAHATGPGAST